MKNKIFISFIASLLCVFTYAQEGNIIISASTYADSQEEAMEILLVNLAHQIQTRVNTSTTTVNNNGKKKITSSTIVSTDIVLPSGCLTSFNEVSPGEYYAEIDITKFLGNINKEEMRIIQDARKYMTRHEFFKEEGELKDENIQLFRELELGWLLMMRDLYDNPISMVFNAPQTKKMMSDYNKIINSKLDEYRILYNMPPVPKYPIYQTINGYTSQILINY